MIACQVALYPLGVEDVEGSVTDALEELEPWREQGLVVEVGSMSTVLRGPDDLVWGAVRALFDKTAGTGRGVVLTSTFSDECGCQE